MVTAILHLFRAKKKAPSIFRGPQTQTQTQDAFLDLFTRVTREKRKPTHLERFIREESSQLSARAAFFLWMVGV